MADPAHQDHQDSLNGKLGRVFTGRWFGWEPESQNVEPCLVGAPFCRQHSKSQIYDEKEDRRIIYFLLLHLENFCYRPLYWPLTSVKPLIRTNMCLLLVSTSTRRCLLMIHR